MISEFRPVDAIIDFLTSFPSPEEVVAYRPPRESQERLDYLLSKQQEIPLNSDEKKELEYFLLIEHLMRVAKLRALQRIQK